MRQWWSYLVWNVVLVVWTQECSIVHWEQSWHCGSPSLPLFPQSEVVWCIVRRDFNNLVDLVGTSSDSEKLIRSNRRIVICTSYVHRLSRWYLRVRYTYLSSGGCIHRSCKSIYGNQSSIDYDAARNWGGWCLARYSSSWWHISREQQAPHQTTACYYSVSEWVSQFRTIIW